MNKKIWQKILAQQLADEQGDSDRELLRQLQGERGVTTDEDRKRLDPYAINSLTDQEEYFDRLVQGGLK